MKKSFLMLGVAAMALASCTQNEVVEYAENRAIQFDTFVNNNTRAEGVEVSTANIEDFWVYGAYNNTSSWVPALTNVQVERSGSEAPYTWTPKELAYWETNKSYNFAAYANGKTGLVNDEDASKVSYEAASNKLTFTNYSAGTNDLVATTVSGKSWNGEGTPAAVALTFKHMLSKVMFTFKTDASKDYTMKVTNLQIDNTAIQTATGTLAGADISWPTSGTKGAYTYDVIGDYADGTQGADGYFSKTSVARYVIPQENTNLTASFTVSVYDASSAETPRYTHSFTGVSLEYTASTGKGTTGEWTEGMVYNYIAVINPDQVDSNAKPIQFTVTTIDSWSPADDNTVVQPQP